MSVATILLVDDSAADRWMLATVLTQQGHRTIEAPDGEQALVMAGAERPDLVISDIVMPKLDGYELGRRIRLNPDLAHTRIVFCTATNLGSMVTAWAQLCGVDRFIPKPAEPELIIRVVDEALASAPLPFTPQAPDEYERSHLTVLADALSRKVEELKGANQRRRRSEEALRQSEDRTREEARRAEETAALLETFMRTAPVGLAFLDTDLRFLRINDFLASLNGLPVESHLGRTLRELFPGELTDSMEPTMREVLETGRPISGLEQIWKRPGSGLETHGLVGYYPVVSREGQILGIGVAVVDITERVRAQIDRERLEGQLHQSQRLESLGHLAGGIAHDFNNLLAVILNYASFAEEELAEMPHVRSDVAEIKRAAERAAALTRQLLIFGRGEMVSPQVLDLNRVVSDMERLLGRTLGEQIELRTRLGSDLWLLEIDPVQLDQILMNLAVNARDAMPDGGRLIIETDNMEVDDAYAQMHRDLNTGAHVLLQVSDTGTGMSAEVAERAFEPFFSTKPKVMASGLGLATVYGIVTRAGGSVRIYSELGKGTAVKVYLPASPQPSAVAVAPLVPSAAARGGEETVLIVEDEKAVAELTRRILARSGYRTTLAISPSAALLVEAVDEPIDLMLTDVVMPGMSGPELATRMRERFPTIKVLYMSGYTREIVDQQGALDSPLIEKPFTEQALLQRVRETLDLPTPPLGAGNGRSAPRPLDRGDEGEWTWMSRRSHG